MRQSAAVRPWNRWGLPSRSVVALYAGTLLLLFVLVYLAAKTLVLAAVAGAFALIIALVAVFGFEGAAYVVLAGAFVSAPMYKRLAPSAGSPVTLTDVLFVVGFGLLLPVLIGRRIRMPMSYVIGVALILVTGVISTLSLEYRMGESLTQLIFWMFVIVALPMAILAWAPSPRMVELFAWSYVAGQTISLAYGLITGPFQSNRYAGFTIHPNYLAQAGLFGLTLMAYVFPRYGGWGRLFTIVGAGICGASILLSGSRAATVVVVVLLVMVAFVERSALIALLSVLFGALGLLLFSTLVKSAAPGSSLARLGGDSTAALSDDARNEGLADGLHRFMESPLRGHGLLDLFLVHNNFLEVMVAVGIFGLFGYLLVLGTFAAPLFGTSPYRRLCYATWAYIGFGATVPSLVDRSIWAVVALGVLAFVPRPSGAAATSDDSEPASGRVGAARVGSPGVSARGSRTPLAGS